MTLTNELVVWLLDSSTPTIRYKTLMDLLDYPISEMAAERTTIMQEGPVPAILAHQMENGTWVNGTGFYGPKYRSTYWTMTLLVELGIDGQDAKLPMRPVSKLPKCTAHLGSLRVIVESDERPVTRLLSHALYQHDRRTECDFI